MAYRDQENDFSLWLPEFLPTEILAESSIDLLTKGPAPAEASPPEEPNCGFIIKDWFGPFLMGPTTRFMRGRC